MPRDSAEIRSTDPAAVETTPWYISRRFAGLWSVLALGSFAEFLLESAAYVWMIDVFGATSPGAAAGIAALAVVSTPRLVAAPFAGVLADRMAFREALAVSNGARFVVLVVALGIAVASGTGTGFTPALLVSLCLLSCFQQLLPSARAAGVQQIVTAADRPKASSLTMIALTVVAIVTAGVAPLIYIALGLPTLLGIAATAFLLAAVQSRRLGGSALPTRSSGGPRGSAGRRFWRELREGWTTCWTVRELRLLLLGMAVYGVALGVNNTALPLFLMGSLSLSPAIFGVISACFSAGTLTGALLAPPVVRRYSDIAVFKVSLVLLGGGYVSFALSPNAAAAGVALFLCGAVFAGFSVAQGPIMQRASPPHLIGRVSTTVGPLMSLVSIGGAAIAGAWFAAVNASSRPDASPTGLGLYGTAILLSAGVLISGGFLVARSVRTEEGQQINDDR